MRTSWCIIVEKCLYFTIISHFYLFYYFYVVRKPDKYGFCTCSNFRSLFPQNLIIVTLNSNWLILKDLCHKIIILATSYGFNSYAKMGKMEYKCDKNGNNYHTLLLFINIYSRRIQNELHEACKTIDYTQMS